MATENIRINYQVIKDSLDAANKELEKLNKNNNLAQKEVEETTQKFKDQDKQLASTNNQLAGLGGELTAVGNKLSIAGRGVGDLGAAMLKSTQSISAGTKALKIFKMALAATGIGALVVALGSLVAFFTKTQKGADMLSRTLAGLGVVVDAIVSGFAKLGEVIVKAFQRGTKATGEYLTTLDKVNKKARETGESMGRWISGNLPGLAKFIKANKELVDGLNDAANAAAALDQATSDLRVTESELSVEHAKRRAEIKKLNKDAEDTRLSEQERLEAVTRAMEIENELQQERVRIAQQKLDILVAQNKLPGDPMVEGLEAENEARVALFNIMEESDEMLTTLNNKRNILIDTINKEREAREELAKQQAEENERQIEAEEILGLKRIEGKDMEQAQFEELSETKKKLAKDNEENQTEVTRQNTEARLKYEEELAGAKFALATEGLDAIAELAGRESTLGKATALAQAGINVQQGITKALTLTPPASFILAGITAAKGALAIRNILATPTPKFEKGGRIGGRLHSEGGTLLEAERDEFIMSRRATAKYGFDFMEKINNLELNPLTDKVLPSSVIVNDNSAIARTLKDMPQNIIHIDGEGFTLSQRRGHDLINRKMNRYST